MVIGIYLRARKLHHQQKHGMYSGKYDINQPRLRSMAMKHVLNSISKPPKCPINVCGFQVSVAGFLAMSVFQGKQSYSIDKFEDVIDLGHEAFDLYFAFSRDSLNMFIIYICLVYPHPLTVTNLRFTRIPS